MSQRRVAIISKNKKISRLVEGELRLLDYEVDLIGSNDGRLDGYFAIICDCTENLINPLGDAKIKLAIVREQAQSDLGAFTHKLPFPFPLQKLRSIMQSNASEDTPEERENAEKALILDEKALTVRLFDVSVSLSRNEYKILSALCKNSGECVSRAALTELLGATDGNIADVYICHLRKKLEEPFGVKMIYSVRGKGYMTKFIEK